MSSSAFRTDHLVQNRDAFLVGDRDVAAVGLAPANAEQLHVRAEDRADVGRLVGEEVAGVGVLLRAAARQLGGEAVDRAAAVRVDETAHQRAGMSAGELELPVGELDLSVVLAAGAVLGEGDEQRYVADL